MASLTETQVAGRRRIYLVRHADVSYFTAGGKVLDTETVPLTAVGRDQAHALGEVFRDVALDRVVTSGLARTRETAALILGGRDVPIEESPELREIRPGRMSNWAPQFRSSPEALEAFFIGSLGRAVTPEDTFLGGESFAHFRDRVVPEFERLAHRPDWRSLLVVAHGGTNRVLLAHALGAPLSAIGNLEQDPACVNIIDVNPGLFPPRRQASEEPAAAPGRYLVRLLNYSRSAPLKKDLRMTTMERIFSESRAAILAMAEKGAP